MSPVMNLILSIKVQYLSLNCGKHKSSFPSLIHTISRDDDRLLSCRRMGRKELNEESDRRRAELRGVGGAFAGVLCL